MSLDTLIETLHAPCDCPECRGAVCVIDGVTLAYAARVFEDAADRAYWHISDVDYTGLNQHAHDPDAAGEAWESILAKAYHTDPDGTVWTLFEDSGDLFAARE